MEIHLRSKHIRNQILNSLFIIYKSINLQNAEQRFGNVLLLMSGIMVKLYILYLKIIYFIF